MNAFVMCVQMFLLKSPAVTAPQATRALYLAASIKEGDLPRDRGQAAIDFCEAVCFFDSGRTYPRWLELALRNIDLRTV